MPLLTDTDQVSPPLIPAAMAAVLSGPLAREVIVDAAHAIAVHTPWPQVRVADVAAAARVSYAAVHHQFGNEQGLAYAVVARVARRVMDGADAAIATVLPHDGTAGVRAALTGYVVEAGREPLERCLLTGERGGPCGSLLVAVDGTLPTPTDLVEYMRDRATLALAERFPGTALGPLAEAAVRTALSHLVAPPREPAPAPQPQADRVRGVALRGRI